MGPPPRYSTAPPTLVPQMSAACNTVQCWIQTGKLAHNLTRSVDWRACYTLRRTTPTNADAAPYGGPPLLMLILMLMLHLTEDHPLLMLMM
jgi:hypothetical protein